MNDFFIFHTIAENENKTEILQVLESWLDKTSLYGCFSDKLHQ